jgi:hypothetical protein
MGARMYRLIALFVGTVIVAGAIGYAIGRNIDDRPAPVTPAAQFGATATPTTVIGETPVSSPSSAERIGAIEDCLSGEEPTAGPATANAATACLQSRNIPGRAITVDGPEPAIVFGLQADAQPLAGQQLFIAWRAGDRWRVQILGESEPYVDWGLIDPEHRFGPGGSLPNAPARETTVGGRTTLVLIIETGAGGSAPELAALLATLDQDEWRLRWGSDQTEIADLSHTTITFGGDGIERLLVSGDSWLLQDDKSRIFHESNPGPHRFFDQIWELRVDRYEKASESTRPSTYNTLVEFVYALRTGDSAVARWVTDPGLVDQAKGMGLDRYPGKPWLTDSDAPEPCCKPISILDDNDLRPLVTFEFVEGASGPLISRISGALPP